MKQLLAHPRSSSSSSSPAAADQLTHRKLLITAQRSLSGLIARRDCAIESRLSDAASISQ